MPRSDRGCARDIRSAARPLALLSRTSEENTGSSLVIEQLPKAFSGVQGVDEISGGGLPRGRPPRICRAAGCGKTLFATEFLVRGATQYGAGRLHGVPRRPRRSWLRMSLRSTSTPPALRPRRSSPSTTSSAARSRRRASATWRSLGPPPARHRHGRCEARGARHDRVTLRWPSPSARVRSELWRPFRWLKDREVWSSSTG